MNRFRLVLVVLLLVATAAFVKWGKRELGRARHPGPLVWVAADTTLLRRDDSPAGGGHLWDGTTIRLAGARNEVLAWQVCIRPVYPVVAATCSLSPFKSETAQLPETACRAFREWFLSVKVPSQNSAAEPVPGTLGAGDYACQLLPLPFAPGGAQPAAKPAPKAAKARGQAKERALLGPVPEFDLMSGETTGLWFDLTIPENAAAGHYGATIKLHLGAKKKPLELPVELEVYPFALPRETHFRNWFYYGAEQIAGYYGEGAQAKLVEQQLVQLAHDHRINLITEFNVPIEPASRAGWWERVGPRIDGSAYRTGPCAGAPAPLIAIGLPSLTDEEAVKSMARATVEFFEPRGLLGKIFLYTVDEPKSREEYDAIRRTAGWIRAVVGHKLPIMVTAPVAPKQADWGNLEDAVDIFCSAESTVNDVRRWRERGGRIWVYNGGWAGAPLIDCPLSGMAAWAPAAWRFDVDGWFMWDALYWRQKHFGVKDMTRLYEDPLTFDETLRKDKDGRPYPAKDALRLNGDGVFFYPGDVVGYNEPLTCVRAKAFRRGAQDYEYLWLLAQMGRKARADRLVRQLITARKEWEPDPDRWLAVRREAADVLMGGK